MTHLHKHRILKWVSHSFAENSSLPLLWATWSFPYNPRFYRTKKDQKRLPRGTRKAAQAALLDYLHCTRMLQFTDAEVISKNSPCFLYKLLSKVVVGKGKDVGKSVARFLRYHPINEFEPFFESLGLKDHEFAPLLPRDLMFLSDDMLLLENYRVLCNYGIARNKIGKIYMEAAGVFRYDHGVLESKLRGFEDLGLSHSSVTKVIVCSPHLLIRDANNGFVRVFEMFKNQGIEFSWVEEHLVESDSYNWSQMLELVCLFRNIGYNEERMVELIQKCPEILFESGGKQTYSIIGFLLKFGIPLNQIHLMFLQFPHITTREFLSNLRQCYVFFCEIEMDVLDIGKFVRSHPLMLGSCALKKTNTLLARLNVGKKRLRNFIQENPHEIKKWVRGSKFNRLPSSQEDMISYAEKTKFLLDLGYVEKSSKMKKALKLFRGKGTELQERFDCIVGAGVDPKVVARMVSVAPQILNQTKELLKSKIDFLVNDLGYPLSTLVTFPSYLNYSIRRTKLRLLMYNWLIDQGTVEPDLSFTTILACSDGAFINRINKHPNGPQVWQDLKKEIYS